MQKRELSLAEQLQENRRCRIELGAFNIFLARQADGSPGSPDEDWLDAEWIEDGRNDAVYVNWLDKVTNGDPADKIMYSVLYCTAVETRQHGFKTYGDMPLPSDRRKLERICAAVSRMTQCQRLAVPESARTIYELVASLLAARHTKPPQ